MDDLRLDDNETILDELSDVLSGVCVGDLRLFARVEPDLVLVISSLSIVYLSLSCAGDGCSESLLTS